MEHLKPYFHKRSRMTEDTYVALSQEHHINLFAYTASEIYHNAPPAILYKNALLYEKHTEITSTGALSCKSGDKTGRSPADKRTVKEPDLPIWWGTVNIPMCEHSYLTNRERAIDYLNLQERIYITDAFAGWDPKYQIKIRIISSRAYHALFMHNMLIPYRITENETFTPDFVIYNAGAFPSNRYTKDVTSSTSICMHYGRGEMVILGSEYAGEMKKGILTLIMYKMPLLRNLPLHSSCNVGFDGQVTLFFGLSGTGKTTLSTGPDRRLIGDDEHVWTDEGIFNVEGGCYAKCKDLSEESEPEIFRAIKFGALLENVILDDDSNADYGDSSITENMRCAYPLSHIPNAIIPAFVATHPSNIIFLTYDAFGVFPPVALLDNSQAMYHFISGYTSKVVGTEVGVLEPTATFSACYGGPFLALHPFVYASLLDEKLKRHGSRVWLVNTGWIGGGYGSMDGYRIQLKYTRKIIEAIQNNRIVLGNSMMDIFNFRLPSHVPDVPDSILIPHMLWNDKNEYSEKVKILAKSFEENFRQYLDPTGLPSFVNVNLDNIMKGAPIVNF